VRHSLIVAHCTASPSHAGRVALEGHA